MTENRHEFYDDRPDDKDVQDFLDLVDNIALLRNPAFSIAGKGDLFMSKNPSVPEVLSGSDDPLSSVTPIAVQEQLRALRSILSLNRFAEEHDEGPSRHDQIALKAISQSLLHPDESSSYSSAIHISIREDGTPEMSVGFSAINDPKNKLRGRMVTTGILDGDVQKHLTIYETEHLDGSSRYLLNEEINPTNSEVEKITKIMAGKDGSGFDEQDFRLVTQLWTRACADGQLQYDAAQDIATTEHYLRHKYGDYPGFNESLDSLKEEALRAHETAQFLATQGLKMEVDKQKLAEYHRAVQRTFLSEE